jgi:RND superfamily putative drug exporter
MTEKDPANCQSANSPSTRAVSWVNTAMAVSRGRRARRSPTAAIGRLVQSLRPLAHVSGVQSPLGPGAGRQLSPDRRTGFVVVQFDAGAAELPAAAVRRVIDTADRFARPGLQVAVGGAPAEQVVSAAPGSAR